MTLPVPSLPPYTFAGSKASYEEARFVVIPVPFDSSTSWGTGARFGPSAIIEASRQLQLYDLELGRAPVEAGITTLPEVEPVRTSTELTKGRVRAVVEKVLRDGKTPVVLGGDHSITPGAVQGVVGEFKDVLYVSFDAHADLKEEFESSRDSHACSSKRCFELTGRAVVFGVRSMGIEEKEFADKEAGVVVVTAREALTDPEGHLRRALMGFEGLPVYMSFDADFLDPSVMPGTGAPEPGGFDWWATTRLLRCLLSKRRVVAMDFVEFSPQQGRRDAAFTMAKLIYKAIGYSSSKKAPD